MNFEWLAALAYPRAIAIHPNFASQGRRSGPGKLASELLEERQLGRADDSDQGAPIEGEAFADICINALRDATPESFLALEHALEDESSDLGERSCAGVLLVALQLESTLPRRGCLDGLLAKLSAESGPTGQLAYWWLRLGAAALAASYGEDVDSEIQRVRSALDNFEVGRPVEFSTAGGLQLSSATVFTRILEFLSHAALQWEIRWQQLGGDLWMQGLRRPTPLILSGLQSEVANGYGSWAKRNFQERFRRQTTVFGGSLLPGDGSMVTAVLVSQCCFHPYGQHAALELGRARFVRGQEIEEPEVRAWAVQSALALLRFSTNKETLQASVRHTLKDGPLAAVTEDLADLLVAIDRRGHLTLLDVEYLQEAATLLSRSQAERLFAMASDELRGVRPAFRERWVAHWSRREGLAKLAGLLAASAEDFASLANLLKDLLDQEYSDELDRLLASALRSAAGIAEVECLGLLRRLSTSPEAFPALRATLAARLGEAVVAGFVPPPSDESPLDGAIGFINTLMRNPTVRPDPTDFQRHSAAVRASLGSIAASLRGSGKSFGGPEPIDVAVAYAIVGGEISLWGPIVELLSNPKVDRSQKNSSLRRIINSASKVPPDARRKLAEGLPGLLQSEGYLFDEGPSPYPAGLAAGAALGILDPLEIMGFVGPWAASPRPASRLDAVTVLGAIPPRSSSGWVTQSLLGLTYDADVDVQADAIQALASTYEQAGAMKVSILERANDLLARDGTWLLRKVLAELKTDESASLREGLKGRVAGLARHPDLRVRQAANEVLGA